MYQIMSTTNVPFYYKINIYDNIFFISKTQDVWEAVNYTSPQSFNNVFLFIGLTSLGTFKSV